MSRRKGGTESTRHHRFESFNQRIAKINVDPVRKVRRHDLDEDPSSTTASYFASAVKEWDDLNTSEDFSKFIREVSPLSETLPQVLHAQEQIVEILVRYLEKRNVLSLEPLLSLAAHFAHDLAARFEKHFARFVTLIASIASKHSDVEVIEWSFACLAWLFKYLARLLVPDLRPTYELMAPLLGKEQQKPFVSRFAAEALSFLVRKAGKTNSHIDDTPLKKLIVAIFIDLQNSTGSKYYSQYREGIMVLFSEAIKGVGRNVHSNGDVILTCLIENALAAQPSTHTAAQEVSEGVLISLIHHTDVETFSPVMNAVLQAVNRNVNGGNPFFAIKLLAIIAGVRNGSRVGNWFPLLDAFSRQVRQIIDGPIARGKDTSSDLSLAAAILLQGAPSEAIAPHHKLVLQALKRDNLSYLVFCDAVAARTAENFTSFVLPDLHKLIRSQWTSMEEALCVLIPLLSMRGCFGNPISPNDRLPEQWETHMTEEFDSLSSRDRQSSLDHSNDTSHLRCDGYINVLKAASTSTSTRAHILNSLRKLLESALSKDIISSYDRTRFMYGRGFLMVAEDLAHRDTREFSLWQILSADAEHLTIPAHLEGLLVYLQSMSSLDDGTRLEFPPSFIDGLLQNLAGPSHNTRLLSLRILNLVYKIQNHVNSDTISLALLIEETPLDIQTVRAVSMHIRKLAALYNGVPPGHWTRKLVPRFCFGLLTVKMSQVWADACYALKQMAESKEGEEELIEIAFEWLQIDQDAPTLGDNVMTHQPQRQKISQFECSNMIRLEQSWQKQTRVLENASEILRQNFEHDHTKTPRYPSMARSLSIRVLSEVPQLAEKRSRSLVPMFLGWVTHVEAENANDLNELTTHLPHTVRPGRWNRKDQKALLAVFAKFINPKVLFRSTEVYNALLDLLVNGDVELQRPALEAIFTWKIPGIVPYEENLRNLLDDARFSEEMTGFLQFGEDSKIEPVHREELMPVLLRLLYGKMIARKGAGSAPKGLEGKRKAVLKAMAEISEVELQQFVHIALDPLVNLHLITSEPECDNVLAREITSPRKQVGMLKMLEDMLTALGGRLIPFTAELLEATLYCLIRASRTLQRSQTAKTDGSEHDLNLMPFKNIRQTGFHVLIPLFSSCPDFSWEPYMDMLFAELISPRLTKFAVETAQAPSNILQLFSAWSSAPRTALYLRKYDQRVLEKITDILVVPSAKDETKLSAVSIMRALISLHDDQDKTSGALREQIKLTLLVPNVNGFLLRLSEVLRQNPSKDLLDSCVETVYRLAQFVTVASEARGLVSISVFLLDQPLRRINPRTKNKLLQVLEHFVPLYHFQDDSELGTKVYTTISSLFGFFRDRDSREILSKVLGIYADQDETLREVARLCIALNSFSPTKIDEPDFEQRLDAFNTINDRYHEGFSAKQWRPILYNMLFYIKDTEELAIRANASLALRRFVESAGSQLHATEDSGFPIIVTSLLVPAIRAGVRESSELVRTEFMAVLAHAIKHLSAIPDLKDMRALLAGEDEEASFFNNVLHIQQHRRARALRRLAKEVQSGNISSGNISNIFMPLVEHFIFDQAEDENAHNLAAEAVTTIGALSEWVGWSQYKAMMRRYISYFESKPEPEKIIIRLLGTMAEALGRAAAMKTSSVMLSSETKHLEAPHRADTENETLETSKTSVLAASMPASDQLVDDSLNSNFSSMAKFLRNKDESFVSLRIPLATVLVRFLKLLPFEQLAERLPPILTDICHILRSRSQDSRDLTRKTLTEIAAILGPQCMGFILKELRGALARGYQLHVLSFTVHSILVEATPAFMPGDLDYCLPQLVAIIMDDIFGVTGQEKDAEDFISKMKEVKSSKSYDSMELIARTVSLERLSVALRPIQALTREKLNIKMVQKIDELLRRLGLGVIRNEAAHSRQVLVFAYELIQDTNKHEQSTSATDSKDDQRTKRYLIQLKGAKKTNERGSTSLYQYKTIRFALDLLRSVLHKYDDLKTVSNISGLLPVIENALLRGQEEIQISSLRLMTAIIKVPLTAIDQNVETYLEEAVNIMARSPDMTTEISQAALKFISAILRDRPSAPLDETRLHERVASLLQRLKPDLEEPDRQGVTFNFIRAVMARKILIPEVYAVLDTVSDIMITNQTRSARDLARGVYFQFLMEYPQGEKRFMKQLAFLAKNMTYQYPEGRQSVLEVIHLLLSKIGPVMIQNVVSTFFVPLVMILINDDSTECREMAGLVMKELIGRADDERTKGFIGLLRTWLTQDEQPLLVRVALQCYILLLDVRPVSDTEEDLLPLLLNQSLFLVRSNSNARGTGDWEMLYFTLQVLTKVTNLFPAILFSATTSIVQTQILWSTIFSTCLAYPHSWVKLSAARLLGLYLADFARKNAESGLQSLVLEGSGGLKLTADEMCSLMQKSIGILRVPGVSEELATQSVRNLVFLGRCLGTNGAAWDRPIATTPGDAAFVSEFDAEDDDDDLGDEREDDDADKMATEGDGMVQPQAERRLAILYLFQRLSVILRRESVNTRGPALVNKTAALSLLAALCKHLPVPTLTATLPSILAPLHHLTDPSIPIPYSSDATFLSGHEAVNRGAQEVIRDLQERVGMGVFAGEWEKVRGGVRGRREERRRKRVVEMVSDPKGREREKRRKGERKRERRKEKAGGEMGRRKGL